MKKNFFKLAFYDLKQGISQNLGKYFISCILFFMFSMEYYNLVCKSGEFVEVPSVLDYLLHIFKGIKVYTPSVISKFDIPINWIIIQLIIAFLVAHYPTNDLFAAGTQVLMRSQSKVKWWISKCIWIIISVILFYAFGIMCIIIFMLLSTGSIYFDFSVNLNLVINGFNLSNVSEFELFLALIALPVLTSIAVSLIQMSLSFMLSPIYSYVIIISFLVFSTYYYSPYLIGNYFVFLRNGLVYQDGFNTYMALIVDFVICVCVIIAGGFCFNKSDILNKKQGE